ncbi:MAG: helix-turn-helix domain-containing protein [Verrucomicrobiota bacterium]
MQEVRTRDFTPLEVYFKHPARGDTAVHQAHFGCPVHFQSGRDALLVSKEGVDAPNKLGDETIVGFFDDYLAQQLASLQQEQHHELQVRRAVPSVMSEGVPSVSSIALELAMSARTLQRRLAEQGYSFQGVVDSARRDLAKRLLHETDYSLAEIAFLTGFADQSAFARAFKRCAGKTPRSYRLSAPQP